MSTLLLMHVLAAVLSLTCLASHVQSFASETSHTTVRRISQTSSYGRHESRQGHHVLPVVSADRRRQERSVAPSSSSSVKGTSTELHAQKKKPRFSQQAHFNEQKSAASPSGPTISFPSSSDASSRRRDAEGATTKGRSSSSASTSSSSSYSSFNNRPPWQSGKSIEDLESIMAKRWGTMDFTGIPEGYEIAEMQSSTTEWRRPVLDPWDKQERDQAVEKGNDDDQKRKKNTSRTVLPQANIVREYYDEDDEGFEYITDDEDDEDDDGANKDIGRGPDSFLQVGHLIAPKPAGGRGMNRDVGGGGSYFFNPNAAAAVVAASSRSNHQKSAPPPKTEELPKHRKTESAVPPAIPPAAEERKPRDRPALSTPLVDESGSQRLFTVGEAIRCFQQTVDEGLLDIVETSDAPIVGSRTAQTWPDLGVTSEVLLENLARMNCPTPLAVQEKTTPAILTGNDVCCGTYTGSGKTLAFLVPLVQRLLWDCENSGANPGFAVLVVAPGRELASQIVSVARELLQGTGLTTQLAIGGTTFSRNVEQMRKRKPNIVVGTPGRIAELVVGKPGEKGGKLKIGSLQSLVMDEFDALLEYKPHRDPTRAIMQNLKRRHGDALQSILCSATATDVMDSANVVDFLRPGYELAMADEDDVLVTDGAGTTNRRGAIQVSRTVLHGVVHLPHRRLALDAVRKILHTEPIPQQILIFVENARKVDIVVEKLGERGIIAAPLHGGMGSEKMDRADVSKALREGYVGIVVATELAARGLDAPLLTHVINLDLPTDSSHYAHRAGRCGRGGRPGIVINITTQPKERNVPRRFAHDLGVEMHAVEPRGGKLLMVDPESQTIDAPPS